MRGDTHVVGGFLANDKLRLPMTLLYLAVKPSLPNAVAVYFLYNALTVAPTNIGSALPDYDRKTLDNCPTCLPNPWDEIFHGFLLKWGATHRSVHTHNVDLWTLILGVPALILLGVFINTKHDIWFLCFIHLNAYLVGVLSHQFLDMLTMAGVTPSYFKMMSKKKQFATHREFREYQNYHSIRITPRKRTMYEMKRIRIKGVKTPLAKPVPIKIPETEWYKGGGGWEEAIYKMMMIERVKHMKVSKRIADIVIIILVYKTLAS